MTPWRSYAMQLSFTAAYSESKFGGLERERGEKVKKKSGIIYTITSQKRERERRRKRGCICINREAGSRWIPIQFRPFIASCSRPACFIKTAQGHKKRSGAGIGRLGWSPQQNWRLSQAKNCMHLCIFALADSQRSCPQKDGLSKRNYSDRRTRIGIDQYYVLVARQKSLLIPQPKYQPACEGHKPAGPKLLCPLTPICISSLSGRLSEYKRSIYCRHWSAIGIVSRHGSVNITHNTEIVHHQPVRPPFAAGFGYPPHNAL